MKYLGAPQSGSQANTTASKNRAGQYYRNRRSPVQPVGTGRRAFIRSSFGSASGAWAALDPAAQAAWNTFAAGHPVTDRLGQAITLTGHQMFVGVGTQSLNVGIGLPTDVPVSTTTRSPVVATFTVDAGAPTLVLTLDAGGDALDYILVSFARPQGSGRTQVSNYWQATVVAGNAGTISGLLSLLTAEFGTLIAGQKIFLKLTPVNRYGWTGTPVITFAVAT
jgi:hypothetical protein